MVQFEELLLKLQALKPEIDDLSDALGMKGMLSEIQQLELKATEPGFWDDVEKSQKVLQRTGSLKGKVEAYEGLVAKYEDTHALIELANEEEDESLLEEAENEVEAVKENLEKQRLQTLLTGEYDKNNAILTFHAGSGGTEAQDWAEMLFRMYNRTHVGQRLTALRLKKLTTLTAMRQDLKVPCFLLKVKMLTAT